jgi:hypothetical protein
MIFIIFFGQNVGAKIYRIYNYSYNKKLAHVAKKEKYVLKANARYAPEPKGSTKSLG